MGIVNEQKFIEQATTAGIPLSVYAFEDGGIRISGRPPTPRSHRTLLNEQQAHSLYSLIRERCTSSGWLGKAIRPWTLVPSVIPTTDEPLIGFEFETSPRSHSERNRIKRELWDTFENYSVDPEGGNAGLEVTFSPEPVSAYTSGTSNAQRFAQEVLSTMELEQYHEDEEYIGTHANISIPGIPSQAVTTFFNKGVSLMPEKRGDENLRLALFGRKFLYGLAYDQRAYTELKVFRTTYDSTVLAQYIERIVNLINGIKAAASVYGLKMLELSCSNLYDVMMEGAAPVMVETPEELLDGKSGRKDEYASARNNEAPTDLSSLNVTFSSGGAYYDDDDCDDDDCYDDDGYPDYDDDE